MTDSMQVARPSQRQEAVHGSRSTSFHPTPTDEQTLCLLRDGPWVDHDALRVIVNRWRSERDADEGFAEYLRRHGVLNSGAPKTIGLVAKGYVDLPDAEVLLTVRGEERLQSLATPDHTAPAPSAPTPAPESVPTPPPAADVAPEVPARLDDTRNAITEIDRTATESPPVADDTPPEIGRRLAGCLLLELLEEGPHHKTFRAFQETNRRAVVVEVLGAASDEVLGARAQWMAAFEHPRLAAILQLDERAADTCVLREDRAGTPLDVLLRQSGPQSPAFAIGLADQLVDVLGAAHASGVVHGNLSPRDVMVDPEGVVVVRSLGLCASPEPLTGGASDRTEFARGADRCYWSPERCGSDVRLSERSDVYSLGALLYHCLTGQLPLEHNSARALLWMHARDGEVPPGTGDVRIPAPIARVLLATLDPDPARRPESLAAVLAELDAALATPARAPAPTTSLPQLRAAEPVAFDDDADEDDDDDFVTVETGAPAPAADVAPAPAAAPGTAIFTGLVDTARERMAASLGPHAVERLQLHEEFARRTGARGRVQLRAAAWHVHRDGAPIATCRMVRIAGGNADIVNALFFPVAPVRVPALSAELMAIAGVPRLAFVDLQVPGLPTAYVRDVAERTQALRAPFAHLQHDEDPPAWALADASGGHFYSRIHDAAVVPELVAAFAAYQDAWVRYVRGAPPAAVLADEQGAPELAQYKRAQCEQTPGRKFLTSFFGEEWTTRFLADFLYQ